MIFYKTFEGGIGNIFCVICCVCNCMGNLFGSLTKNFNPYEERYFIILLIIYG